MRIHTPDLKKAVYDWYHANKEKLEVPGVRNVDLTEIFISEHPDCGHAFASVLKSVQKTRAGTIQFRSDVLNQVRENLKAAEVFRPVTQTTPVYFEGDQPDFTDPISAMIEIPESWAEINEPYTITGIEHLGVTGDWHLPYHDRFAIQACLAEFKNRKVDGILLNGDIMDYEKVSHYAQMPDGRYLKDEINVGRKMLQSLRQMFPNIKIIYKAGNHERRLEAYIAERCPELYNAYGADTPTQLGLAELGIEYIPEQQIMQYGKLYIAHGHELGLKSGTVNIARQVRMRVGVNIIFGHWHKNQTDSSRNLADDVHAAWALGCLCYLKPRYTGVMNQWTQGAATVKLHEDGKNFTVSTFQIQDGVVI